MTMLLLRMLMTRQRSLSYEVWLELTAVIADSYLDRPLQLPTRQGGWQGGEGEGVGYYMVVDKAHITLGLGPAGTSLAFLPTQGKQVHYHPHTQHTNTTHTETHIRKHTTTKKTDTHILEPLSLEDIFQPVAIQPTLLLSEN